jgi:hypothetical protein
MSWTKKKRKLIKKIKLDEAETKHGIQFEVFKNTPESAKLREEDIGKRVWLAAYPRTTKAKLNDLTDKDVKIKFTGEIPIITVHPEEVMLHPGEWTKERFKDE